MFVLLIVGGVLMTLLGFIGVYVGYIFQEAKQRPLYLLRPGPPPSEARESGAARPSPARALPRHPPDAEDTAPGCAMQPPRSREVRKAATPPD